MNLINELWESQRQNEVARCLNARDSTKTGKDQRMGHWTSKENTTDNSFTSELILYLKKTSLPISYEGHVICSKFCDKKDSRNTC